MAIKHRARRVALALGALAILPLGLVAAGSPAQASHAQYEGKVTSSTGLNVRSAPTSASSKVGSLSRGATIKIHCKVLGPPVGGSGLWYKLSGGDWVTARHVSNVGAAPRFCGDGKTYQGKVVAQTSLNVRSGPNTANAKLYSNARGEIIDLVCKVDSQTVGGNPRWYQLPSDSSGQWVSARYMSNIGTAPPYC